MLYEYSYVKTYVLYRTFHGKSKQAMKKKQDLTKILVLPHLPRNVLNNM
jgi:hypothetical protein